MKNVIILGSGRSGTSMVAGTLASAGYFMGERLLNSSPSNPKGFFEDAEINLINEDILKPISPKRPRLIGNLLFRDRPLRFQRWLLRLPLDVQPNSSASIDVRIRDAVSNVPFCYKDPRFSYTLPVWRPYLENAVFICVFRHPSITAKSIVKECRDDTRLHSLKMNLNLALDVWISMYRHIVEVHRWSGEWLFLHYEQAFSPEGLYKIRRLTQASVDESFPDRRLNRTTFEAPVPEQAKDLYEILCHLADADSKEMQ